MKRYLLNSAVITNFGTFKYECAKVQEAKAWLASGAWDSTIGYQETADALSQLMGVEVPLNRVQVKMDEGDQALVFRLILPPGTPRIQPGDKGRLTPEFVAAHSELGLLTRIK